MSLYEMQELERVCKDFFCIFAAQKSANQNQIFMKKITLIYICCFAMIASVLAGPVDSTTAKQLATTFWNQQIQPLRGDAQNVDFKNVASDLNFSNLYILQNTNGTGFVIMSADDRALPILGYAEDGQIDLNNLPTNFLGWLGGYESQIEWVKTQDEPTPSDITVLWNALRNEEALPTRSTTAVSPLLSTTWDQGSPYNAQCPGATFNRAPTGCVATAMAQVMKYWAYPSKGIGSHSYVATYYNQTLSANFGNTTYAWSSMPNNVTSSNSAVATLMFHCGVAVEMGYEPNGSGAQTIAPYEGYPSAETALFKYFGYSKSLHGEKKSSYTDSEWWNMVKADLDAGRPVIYSGFDAQMTAGHCFVCDGYNSSNQGHFNWGWSGSYNGYFSLSALTPGGGGWGSSSSDNYSYGNDAIFGLEPPGIQVNANSASASVQNGQSVSISVTYKNKTGAAFNGGIRLVIENEDGAMLQKIQEYSSVNSVANNGTANATFANVITAAPGNYYISLYYKPTGTTTWLRAGAGTVANPKELAVVLNPDQYENNNTTSAPYVFTPTFTNNRATVVTTGSNFHVGDELDYYKFTLPEGYSYTVSSRLHDSENSGNGQSYSMDVSMKISQNGGSWGAAVADVAPDFTLQNGGPVLYRVYPAVSGSFGTYLLDVTITRTSNTGIEDNASSTLAVYPNPTSGVVTAQCGAEYLGGEWQVYDLSGRLLYSQRIDAETMQLNFSHFADGVYIMKALAQGQAPATVRFVKAQ